LALHSLLSTLPNALTDKESISISPEEAEAPAPPAWRRWAKLGLKLAVTAVILIVVARNFADLGEVWTLLLASHKGWVAAALAFLVASKVLSSFRLNQFLRATGIALTEGANWRLYMRGMYYNLFLPGGVGGDGYKMVWLNRNGHGRKRDMVWPLLLDRINGLAALGALALALFLYIPYQQYVPLPAGLWPWASAALWASIPVLYLAYFGVQHKLRPAYSRIFVSTSLYSLGVQALQAVSAVCILASLGVQDHYAEYLVLFYASSIAFVVPITVGGLGSRELVFSVGAHWMGLDPDRAVVVGLVFYIISAIFSLSGVYYAYRPVVPNERK
jgi:uncharacterized membrane protein YbhN (UPF0104 family)